MDRVIQKILLYYLHSSFWMIFLILKKNHNIQNSDYIFREIRFRLDKVGFKSVPKVYAIPLDSNYNLF